MDLFHENQSNLEFVLFFLYVLDLVYSSFRSRIYFCFSLTPNRRWTGASPTNPKILWMIQKKFTGKGDKKHDQGTQKLKLTIHRLHLKQLHQQVQRRRHFTKGWRYRSRSVRSESYALRTFRTCRSKISTTSEFRSRSRLQS